MCHDYPLTVWLWSCQKLKSFCSPDLEYLTIKCQPYYLPREFSAIIATADTTASLKELHWSLCKLETTYPEAAYIVAGDFNKENLRKKLQKFYQHIDCCTHAAKTLDHCYTTFQNAYKALLHPPFGKSDHDSTLLLPSYRQKLKQEPPMVLHHWLLNSQLQHIRGCCL